MRLKLIILAIVLALGLIAAPALARSHPTVAQVRHQVAALNHQVAHLDDEYDQSRQQLGYATSLVQDALATARREQVQVTAERRQVAQLAVASFANSGESDNPLALLTSGDAQTVLNKASVLQALSQFDAATVRRYEAVTGRLTVLRQQQARYSAATQALRASLSTGKSRLAALTAQEQSLLRQLAPDEQHGLGPGGRSQPVTYSGPTSSQAGKAVAFVYAQLGCQYTWGGTGPCSSGFDCSGLVQAAWASAGVAIERTSEDQLASLPKVPQSEIRPGDLLIFLGGDHVGMYVGGGYLIDAPHTGAVIERVAFSGWYQENLTAIVRP